MSRILSVSYDEPLLRTRQMLLETRGHTVTSALGFTLSLEQCKHGGFDLFILGHSIPPADKKELVTSFRQKCDGPVISLLRPNEPLVDGADYHIQPDPEPLLALVDRIYARP